MLSYGNTGTPVTMNMGGFKIQYREPLCGGNRVFLSCRTATVLDAVAEFNLINGGFDTPLRVERFDTFGNLTHTFSLDGRYAVPRDINIPERQRPSARRRNKRRYS